MGLDMTLLVVDWAHLQGIPPLERERGLTELEFPDDEQGGYRRGVVWPIQAGTRWCAEYEFCTGLGSYKPHFWAGEAWGDARAFTAPAPRALFDPFLDGLIWLAPDTEELGAESELLPRWNGQGLVSLLVLCTPPQAAARAHAWQHAGPHLEELRAPFTAHAAGRWSWMDTFDNFAALLRDWGEVTLEAERRGWGLIGLPY
ncbi:hypothetical protein ACQB60_40485 [Actinomycetota bacterium Odt1-20B]